VLTVGTFGAGVGESWRMTEGGSGSGLSFPLATDASASVGGDSLLRLDMLWMLRIALWNAALLGGMTVSGGGRWSMITSI
jgi:hypothetical protein